MDRIFRDRTEAGRFLAANLNLLSENERQSTVILALPRGGVPVAHEVSQVLGVDFDVLIVRKIGHPRHPEYGVGAMTEEGLYWIDPEAVSVSQVVPSFLNQVIENEKQEVERRMKTYRQGRPLLSLEGKIVIIVDDGVATGVTARVAVKYAKLKGAIKIILAAPVCSKRTAFRIREEISDVICVNEPDSFSAVGEFYENFDQTTDQEVLDLLSTRQVQRPPRLQKIR